jgi:medium-chain acyl-[acyl-carrier-protein] hydrolase
MANSAWLTRFPRPSSRCRLTLVCFPHAGAGAAASHGLARLLPEAAVETVAVVLPGREARLREPPLVSMAAIVDGAAAAIAAHCDGQPLAFFGHSMGAIVAFEVAKRFHREGRPLPARLFLSGRRALNQPSGESPLSMLDDAGFVAEMARRYGGLPAAVLEDAELLRLFLPAMRADIRAIEGYRLAPDHARLPVPFTLMGGTDDPQCSEAAWAGWRELSSVPIEMLRFPGGHFYFLDDRASMAQAIGARLASLGC